MEIDGDVFIPYHCRSNGVEFHKGSCINNIRHLYECLILAFEQEYIDHVSKGSCQYIKIIFRAIRGQVASMYHSGRGHVPWSLGSII